MPACQSASLLETGPAAPSGICIDVPRRRRSSSTTSPRGSVPGRGVSSVFDSVSDTITHFDGPGDSAGASTRSATQSTATDTRAAGGNSHASPARRAEGATAAVTSSASMLSEKPPSVPHSPGTRGTPSHGQASASATAPPMLEAAAEAVPGEILAACHARASARHAPSAVRITEALPMVAAPSPHRPRTRRSAPGCATSFD